MATSQRLYILNNRDFSATYCPRFSDLERRHFFIISEPELQIVKLMPFNGRETSSKLYFILQLGYFKAKHLFFKFQLSDIVCRTMILIEIFEDLKNTLEKAKVVLLAYSAMQDAIGSAIKNEENRVIQIVEKYLTPETEQALQSLFAIEDVFYKIPELKLDAKSFRTQEMQGERDKLQVCYEIYLFSNTIGPPVDISRKNIDYCSNFAQTYTVYRLKRFQKALAYFYVTYCVHDRYEKIVNHLIKGFVYYYENKKLFEVNLKLIPMTHVSPKKLKEHFFENNFDKSKIINTYQLEPLIICVNKRALNGENAKSKLDYLGIKTTLLAVDYLVDLPIFDSYNLDGLQQGSIDGKKKKTKRRTLQSPYSPKYFGLDIGVVIMTMNLNNRPFVTNIIDANEPEGPFTYSMLMENITAIISTDTEGTNNVNDFLYFLIGKTHAACYRSTANKAETISGFKPVSEYERLIEEKWPGLVAIDVKDALWELNNILKSIHLLKYVDNPNYRINIRTALNRGEGYHQLLDKITIIGGGDFRGMSEVEIWNECTRLIGLTKILDETLREK